MLPDEIIDAFQTVEGCELALVRRGPHYFIEMDSQELMSTERPTSELALAELGCRQLPNPSRPRVLIGGLGLGYTLRGALACLPPDASVVVAELFPEIVKWNRDHLAHLYDGTRDDRRTTIVERDVWDQVARGPWDAILLDTDNGAEAWCLEKNQRLYGHVGLERLLKALIPGGTLAIWSTDPDPGFVLRMRKAGFQARSESIWPPSGKGPPCAILLGRRRARPRLGSLSRSRQ